MKPSVEFVEHPGEVRLRLQAATLGELAVVAGRALAELELGRAPGPRRGTVARCGGVRDATGRRCSFTG